MTQHDFFKTPRRPWNAGRIVGPKGGLRTLHSVALHAPFWSSSLSGHEPRSGNGAMFQQADAILSPLVGVAPTSASGARKRRGT